MGRQSSNICVNLGAKLWKFLTWWVFQHFGSSCLSETQKAKPSVGDTKVSAGKSPYDLNFVSPEDLMILLRHFEGGHLYLQPLPSTGVATRLDSTNTLRYFLAFCLREDLSSPRLDFKPCCKFNVVIILLLDVRPSNLLVCKTKFPMKHDVYSGKAFRISCWTSSMLNIIWTHGSHGPMFSFLQMGLL